MTDQLVLFLPPDAAAPANTGWRWLRIVDDAVAARGEGAPVVADDDQPVVITPASAVTLHWAVLPDRSAAQATAAARIVVADTTAAALADLHIAVGRDDGHHERSIGVVSAGQMTRWLDELAGLGVDPLAMVPAPLLLPRPDSGFVRADLGGEAVIRGSASGFADEPPLTGLVTNGEVPENLPRDAVEAAVVAAVKTPPLDLRQGKFARRQRRAVDWRLIRRLARLTAGLLAVSLAITLAQLLRYSASADALERQADTLARQALPPGEIVGDPDRQLDDRLSRLRGGGFGFSRSTAAIYSAIRATPGAELRALSFDESGIVRVTIAAEGSGQANDVRRRIEANGFKVVAGSFQANAGQVSGDLTISPP